jgi:hypothetical protein
MSWELHHLRLEKKWARLAAIIHTSGKKHAMATNSITQLAKSLIEKHAALQPELDELQACVNAAAKKVAVFIEAVEKHDYGYEWSEDWEWAWIAQLDLDSQRILGFHVMKVELGNFNTKTIEFYDEAEDETYVLPFKTIEQIDSVIEKGRKEFETWLAEQEDDEDDAIEQRQQRREELLEELAALDEEDARARG